MTGTIILPLWLVVVAGVLLIVLAASTALAITAWYRAAVELEDRKRAAVDQIVAPTANAADRLRFYGRAAGEVFGG